MQHVRRLRLERAARHLRTSEEGILALALEAGYESHEAFTRAFSERFGLSPSAFRAEPSARLTEWKRQGDSLSVDVVVQNFPAVPVAFARYRGSYLTMEPFWQRMVTWAAERGLLAQEAPLYGLCPDDPDVTAEEHLRFDACVVVGAGFAPEGIVGVAEIPAGTYAVGLHRGPYDRLADTYLNVIGRWFPQSGYELAAEAAVVEHYLNDPRTTASADLRTEVRVKIAD
jgi:AraC family transcriptional regulator